MEVEEDRHQRQPTASSPSCLTDWSLCALCQQQTKEKLQCPAKAKQKGQGSSYNSLAENLTRFHELGHLQRDFLSRLNEGDTIEETFKKRNACSHVSCRLRYNTSKLKRKAAAATVSASVDDEGEQVRKLLRKDLDTNTNSNHVCFICDKEGERQELRNASTFQLDEKVRKCALLLQDKRLLTKLSAGDIIAQELKYHHNCLTHLYRKAQPKLTSDEFETHEDQMYHGLVFAELTEYMQEERDTSSGGRLVVFRLADLANMYQTRLDEYDLQLSQVHSSRLKTRLLAHFPDLQAHTSGRDVMLTFANNLSSTLKDFYTETWDDEAVHLAKAARIVRRDLFLLKSQFTGSYDEHCQNSCVPETLLALMKMILQGTRIAAGGRSTCQAALTLAQLAIFNATKTEGKRARQDTSTSKHSKDRETPLPVYVGMSIHAQTRKKELVDSMYTLGLSISYARVLEISSELANKACHQFQEDGVVCPMKLKFGLFTTAAVDNIDHNPSSTTAKDSFHGTAISLFQHPTESNTGTGRTCIETATEPAAHTNLTVPDLPKFYSDVPPFALRLPVEPTPSMNAHSTDVTSQNAHGTGDTSQTAHCTGDTSQTAHGTGDTSQTAHGTGDTSQTAHGKGDSIQHAHGTGDISQNAHCTGDTSQTAHCTGDTSHTAHGTGDTSQTAHCTGDTSQNAHCTGDTIQNAHGTGDTSQTAHGTGDISQNAHCTGDTIQHAHGTGDTSQTAHGTGDTIQHAHGTGDTSQNAHCTGDTIQHAHGTGDTSQNAHCTGDTSQYDRAAGTEKQWLENVETAVKEQTAVPENVSWGAYHAALEHKNSDRTPGISSLLPLFHEQSKTPAMMKHAMDIVKMAVNFLNPGQNAVIACDQPLFALAKQIQWKYPELYGEGKITVMFGGLHTEMAFLKAIGTLLRDSGWTDVLVQAGVATAGVADSFLSVSHITRTRHAHQLSVCALSKLVKMAFEQYHMTCEIVGETPLSLDDWKMTMAESTPTFHFWHLIMELEVLLLIFLAALRSGDFSLYLQSITRMAPVFFAVDQQNYARWLSVHIKDMSDLNTVESIFPHFRKGHFVLQKSRRPFSKLALDHAHEQNNALVKGDGGAVGLTDNPSALRRWMISGPEVARVIGEFEMSLERRAGEKLESEHHEQSDAFQVNFRDDVAKLAAVIQDAGNPFSERGTDFISLHSKDIIDPAAHDSMKELLAKGGQQFDEFIQERLVSKTKKLSDPIKRNNPVLIAGKKGKRKAGKSYQISSLKNDCHLFSRLYIGCQTRSGGLDDFFMYENQATPPSLSSEGKLRSSTKSSLLECLESLDPTEIMLPEMDVLIVDGAAVVNMIRPGPAKTFRSYAESVFAPYISHMLKNVTRLDLVWDLYRADSLKSSTRENRGVGKRKRVMPETVIPANWNSFLRVDDNKEELFHFLAQYVIAIKTKTLIITTQGSIALSNSPVQLCDLSPCTHEEADSRMMVHLSHAAKDNDRIVLRTVDTDVVVLAVTAASHLPHHEVWVAMGTGKDFRHIPAHHIAKAIGPEKSRCLPIFHSFTGCDTVSFFNGVGKKKAWEVWHAFQEVTQTFLRLSAPPCELTTADRAVLERFVVLLYDKTSNFLDVNSARRYLFSKKRRQIDHIPPTSEALLQHMKRAIYQGGYIWSQAEIPTPTLPSPTLWGWQRKAGKWEPFWTSLPEASSMCRELLKCGCKKSCTTRRCKCCKERLKCSALCSCACITVKTPSD